MTNSSFKDHTITDSFGPKLVFLKVNPNRNNGTQKTEDKYCKMRLTVFSSVYENFHRRE